MRHNSISAAKKVIFALGLVLFFFTLPVLADTGCHTQNGCGTNASDIFNSTPFGEPAFSPAWTDVTKLYRVYGGQYLRFAVQEGQTYRWSTVGGEDDFHSVKYAANCYSDSDCFNNCATSSSDNCDIQPVLKCLGKTPDIDHGFCLYPFDTELTLLKGDTCSKDAEFLAYSNSDGFYSQSQIEWKANFSGTVVLLVTNYEAQADGSFATCRKTSSNVNTTVKWQRASSDHCTECGDPDNYAIHYVSESEDGLAQAPAWEVVSSADQKQLNSSPSAYDEWIKPGSYIVFDVEEGNIYRWSTCVPMLPYDTQLSLFKGDAANNKTCTTDPDTGEVTCSGDCSTFLAYSDDSDVSYTKDGTTLCPVGTKQSVVEWHANYTGKVTLLFNEYNCYQCGKRDYGTESHWAHCYATTTSDGTTYIQPMPLEWQKYDCESDDGTYTSPKYRSGDFCGVNSTTMEPVSCSSAGYSKAFPGVDTLNAGEYMEFSLKRGSKYLFTTSDKNALITIKAQREGWSSYRTLAQGTGELSYFAGSYGSTSGGDPSNYSDVIIVMVSAADCRKSGSIQLTYKFYPDTTADSRSRFESVVNADGSKYYIDKLTNARYKEEVSLANSWADALDACQNGNTAGGIFDCPDPACPQFNKCYQNNGTSTLDCRSDALWKDAGSCTLMDCDVPVCGSGYAEYSGHPTGEAGNTYYSQFKGVCYATSGTGTDVQTIGVQECPEGYVMGKNGNNQDTCYKPDGNNYDLTVTGTAHPEWENWTDSVITGVVTQCAQEVAVTPSFPTDSCGRYVIYDSYISETTNYSLLKESKCSDKKCCSNKQNGYTKTYCCCADDDNPLRNNITGDAYKSPFYWGKYTSDFSQMEDMSCSSGTELKCTNEGFTLFDVQPGTEGWVCNKEKGCYKCNTEGLSESDATAMSNPANYQFLWDNYNYKCVMGCYFGAPQREVDNYPSAKTWECLYSCTNGGNILNIGGELQCGECPEGYSFSNQQCVKACPADKVKVGGKCYTETADFVWRCPTTTDEKEENNWVEVESGKCRKVNRPCEKFGTKCKPYYIGTSKYYKYYDQYVACKSQYQELANDTALETCDVLHPNSDACHCRTVVARQIIGGKTYKYYCEQKLDPQCNKYEYNGHTYTSEDFTLITEGGRTYCQFTDITGSVCGKPMGGWTLPNINQLYAIVDFDLYDPATVFPLSNYIYGNDPGTGCAPVPGEGSDDPYGDKQCSADGSYICVDKKCVRNNWYWSSTTVFDKDTSSTGKFVWSVNMQDGRSYRAVKGCPVDDTVCEASSDLNARAHRVLCVKGSTVAGIFDADAPALEQTFSGWSCDKSDSDTSVNIYFEITDNKGRNVATLTGIAENPLVTSIPGQGSTDDPKKGFMYGPTDVKPTSAFLPDKWQDIYNNCGFEADPVPHAFELNWHGAGSVTSGKEDLAALIMSIDTLECDAEGLAQYAQYESGDLDDAPNCTVPPYFVTAYAENPSNGLSMIVAPEKRPFVFHNDCGDGYMTYDGIYAENCEDVDFGNTCGYGNPNCKLCAKVSTTVDGEPVNACTLYEAHAPSCMDGTLQSQYCENVDDTGYGTVASGAAAGAACVSYDFEAEDILSQNEECDCAAELGYNYYLWDGANFSCSGSKGLSAKVCPDYFTGVFNPDSEDAYCYICSGCKKERVAKAHCGDGIRQHKDCSDNSCQKVAGAEEECDDGNSSNTDDCKNDCTLPACGDGIIQKNLGEVCDSGEYNGYYEKACGAGTVTCPGCASSTCGIAETDPLGPRCGDGVIQNQERCYEDGFLSGDGALFDSVEDCEVKLATAHELCDLGANNGKEVKFEQFINQTDPDPETDPTGCFTIIAETRQPVSSMQSNYAECVYKYKKFIEKYSGCSADCTRPEAPYCGDGIVDPSEACDEGLPVVKKVNGEYQIAESATYNGKGYGSCRFDCSARYNCGDNFIEVDCNNPSGCPIGTEDSSGNYLYVSGGKETCDQGILNGGYGRCADNCLEMAMCGNGNKKTLLEQGDCIREEDGVCVEYEECDFGREQNGNKSIQEGYSRAQYGSCISESEDCQLRPEERPDSNAICCKFGRYCGDGIVDNGEGVKAGDKDWFDAENWDASNMTVTADSRELVMVFTLNGVSAETELDIPIPVQGERRYFVEYDMKVYNGDPAAVHVYAGANQYSDEEGTTKITDASCPNNSPYYFVDNGVKLYSENGHWYHSKNASPVEYPQDASFVCSTSRWMWGTKTVKLTFKVTANTGTVLHLRGLKFYAMEELQEGGLPKSGGGGAREMCDAGTDNILSSIAGSDNTYMVNCTDACKWTNYCGDGEVFEGQEICDNGTNSPNVYGGCEPGCIKRGPFCGDGILNRLSCSGYAEGDCVVPAMGLSENEECDNPLGNSNDPLAAGEEAVCRENCKYSKCGDGILDFGEECDCGVAGLYAEDEWPDTIHQFAVEQFETDASGNRIPIKDKQDKWIYPCVYKNAAGDDVRDYNTYSATRSGSCRPDCKLSTCGDGILGPGEKCDDGNLSNDDSCLNGCQQLDECGDGYFSSKRSYLCEELLGTITNSEIGTVWTGTGITSTYDLQNIWSQRGVVECGPGKKKTCEALAGELKSGQDIYDNLIAGVIHCCFNPKLIGEADNHNCEIELPTGGWDKPRERALKRCMTTKRLNSFQDGDDAPFRTEALCETDKLDDQLERCDFNSEVSAEECETKYKGDKNKERRELCIAQVTNYHTYCNRETCYNVTGGCGDGERNYVYGTDGQKVYLEACDRNFSGDDADPGFYYNMDGTKIYKANGGEGDYCTGKCRGDCYPESGQQKPMCSDEITNNCWETNGNASVEAYWLGSRGCTDYQHNGTAGSKCGDGTIDTFAGEKCDDGNTQPGDYCSADCKRPTGSCGDGIKQNDSAEKCDNKVFEDGESCDATVQICDNAGCHLNDCTKVKGEYCSTNCQEDYGSCGDGKIKGPGYDFYDGYTAADSLVTLDAPNQVTGPEDCDRSDARTVSLVNTILETETAAREAFLNELCDGTCKKPSRCGDGTRNYRFEGCDCGNGNGNGSGTCAPKSKSGNLTLSGLEGYHCHANCNSDPIGQVYSDISPKRIHGWACDPDHPMIDGSKYDMVKIVFFNKNNQPATDASAAHNVVPPLYAKTGLQVPEEIRNDVVTICGGGQLQGWEADPSSAHIDPAQGPYTIKVYAIPLKKGTDPNPVDGNENEVLIGTKTNFVTAMQCGDKVVTKCSQLSVVLINPITLEDGQTTTTPTLYDGWECHEGDLVGGCAAYGFEDGQVCRDEVCDDITGIAFGRDGDCYDKDYPNDFNDDMPLKGRGCQWTWCGDGIIQNEATTNRKHTGIFGNPEEECDPGKALPTELSDSEAKACSTLGLTKPATDDVIVGTTKTCDKTCRFDRTAGCKLQSKCPSLKDVVAGWKTNYPTETSGYVAADYANYVTYHSPTYFRDWECSGSSCNWSGTKSAVYKDENATADDHACEFYCNTGLVWNGHICAPISAADETNRIKTNCAKCTGTDNTLANGIWNDGVENECKNTKTAYIGTAVEGGKVYYVVPQPDGTNKKEEVGGLVPTLPASYNASATIPTYQCSWKCGPNSYYSEKMNKCYPSDKTYECKGKPDNSVWVKVKSATDTSVVTEVLGSTAKLSVSQTYDHIDTTTGVAIYDPDETEKYTGAGLTGIGVLQAMYVNADSGLSAYAQRSQLKKYTSNPRCFWVCRDTFHATKNSLGDYSCTPDNELDPETRCPTKGKVDRIYNEDCSLVTEVDRCEVKEGYHQKCNDTINSTSYNGKYGSWTIGSQKVSHCDAVCGEGSSDALGRIVKKDTSDRKFYCGDGVTQSKAACEGIDCVLANTTNYPGADSAQVGTNGVVNELCDGTPTSNTRTALCNRFMQYNSITLRPPSGKTYYDVSSIACKDDCISMTNISTSEVGSGTANTSTTYPCGFCGDGKINYFSTSEKETCDPGLNSSGGYDNDKWSDETTSTGTTKKCKTNCSGWAPYCGDGTKQSNETCDSGTSNNDGWTLAKHCKKDCSAWAPYCGDGVVQNANESCDTNLSSSYGFKCHVQGSSYSCNCSHGGTNCSTCYHYDIYTVTCSSSCSRGKSFVETLNDSTSGSSGACSAWGL